MSKNRFPSNSDANARLSRINTLLLIAIIVVNSYLVAMPFMPALVFKYSKHSPETSRKLAVKIQKSAQIPSVDTSNIEELIIPSIGMDQKIFEGKDMSVLRQGLWHRPHTSTPDKNSNTVIVGHRFTYSNPRGIFYDLDKIAVGDHIGLIWHGTTYQYTVKSSSVVPPSQIAVEDPTPTPQLTLYTCTPLWWPKDRLVIVAQLENQ